MDFETFLKKKGYREWNPKTKVTGKITSLSVKSLGEWAWKQVNWKWVLNDIGLFRMKWDKETKYERLGWVDITIFNFHKVEFVYWNIAMGCLGMKVIEKRIVKLRDAI